MQDAVRAAEDDPGATITGEIAAVNSLLTLATTQATSGDEMIAQAKQALEHLPESSILLRDIATWGMAFGHYQNGDEATAQHLFTQATSSSVATGNLLVTLLAFYTLAVSQMTQGYLNRVEELCRQMASIVDLQEHPIVFSGLASLAFGDLMRERGDLEQAERYLQEGIALSQQLGTPPLIVNACVDLARTKQAQGDMQSALDIIDKAEQLARQEGGHPSLIQVEAIHIQMLVAENRLQEAHHWLEERSQPGDEIPFTLYPDTPFVREMENFTLARILLAQGRYADASTLVDRTLDMSDTPDNKASRIEGLFLKALALHAAGSPEDAFSALDESLGLAEPEGFCRLLADVGAPAATLLRDYLKAGRAAPAIEQYARALLAAIGAPTKRRAPPRREAPALIEPLSDRERDILSLVAEGLTNQEIALRLTVSLSTVKWHLYNAYGKMNVRNRTEAVARARELGLLSS